MRSPPKTITAHYRFLTPMFIGDADQKATGINPGAFKGALRFWWRALHWGRIASKVPDTAKALQKLHTAEGELFGSAADNGPGQAQFLLRIDADGMHSRTPEKPGCGIQYLLGQGLYHFSKGYLRDALAPADFSVSCRLRPGTSDAAQKQLCEALLAVGTLGGLGSRARKGFGSLAIQSLTGCDAAIEVPTDAAGLKQQLERWRQTVDLPPFTAFSRHTRVDLSLSGDRPMTLLNQAGSELQLYRSWGRNGTVCGQPNEHNFRDDHDLMLNVGGSRSPKTIPKRSVFGLPHNYFFSSTKKKVDFNAAEKDRSRRASPLFIHVHQFPNGENLLLHLLLPARFLPKGDKLEFKPQRSRSSTLKFRDDLVDWRLIHTYMDRFGEREPLL